MSSDRRRHLRLSLHSRRARIATVCHGRTRVGWGAAATLAVAALLVGGWGVHAVSADRATTRRAQQLRTAARTETRSLSATRDSTQRTITALDAALRARTADRDSLVISLFSAKGRLAETQAELGHETSGLAALDARVSALRSCLQGVSGALNALSVDDSDTAITRLRAVGTDCDAAS